jgi:hypothetical protein
MTPELIKSLLDRAQTEEIGLVLDITNPYRARKLMNEFISVNRGYSNLKVSLTSQKDQIMIEKKLDDRLE